LKKAADEKFYIYTAINNKMAVLNRIFVRINGGSFWLPNIEYVEFKGIDPITGLELLEKEKFNTTDQSAFMNQQGIPILDSAEIRVLGSLMENARPRRTIIR